MTVIAHATELLNTLNLKAVADRLLRIDSRESLLACWQIEHLNQGAVLVLGEGSNVILPGKLGSAVLRYEGKRVHFEAVDADRVVVTAEAGLNWDQLVAMTVKKGLRGLENLSLIPGTVGAAPVQNIGAYGVELSNLLTQVEAFDLQAGCFETFSNPDCRFAYRDSVFKANPGRYLITALSLELSYSRPFVLEYGELQSLAGSDSIDAASVRDKVIATRQAKLPDPDVLPNAGSFFKNPVVTADKAAKLREQFPAMVQYELPDGQVKLAAGWLLDQAGWKGKRLGALGMHEKQALVMVNYAQASQADVLAFATEIQQDIRNKYGVELEIEPVVIT